MVVLFVAFQTSNLANGGMESFVSIVERLDGVRRIVVTDRRSRATDRLRAAGCEIHVVEPSPLRNQVPGLDRMAIAAARKLPRMAAFNAVVFRLARQANASVVHCNDISAFWHAALGARAAGARLVFTVRDMFPRDRPYGPRWTATRSLADELLVLSEEMQREVDVRVRPMIPWGDATTSAIHSIVDLARMRPASRDDKRALRSRLELPEDAAVITLIGAFCPKKGQLELLRRAAPQILEQLPSAHLLFVGDFAPERDEYAARCRAEVDAFPASMARRIRFLGFSSTVEDTIRASDIVTLASLYEGLPRAMIESVACGVPVVALEVTSAREVLHDERGHASAGVVVGAGDFVSLAAEVVRLCRDPSLREEMGRVGRAVAERLFDPEQQLRKHLALYRRLIARDVVPSESRSCAES